jgi:hypothetical protein
MPSSRDSDRVERMLLLLIPFESVPDPCAFNLNNKIKRSLLGRVIPSEREISDTVRLSPGPQSLKQKKKKKKKNIQKKRRKAKNKNANGRRISIWSKREGLEVKVASGPINESLAVIFPCP